VTKGAAVEATSVLSNSFPDFTERRIGQRLAAKARRYVHLCSTVKDALLASSVGIKAEGVTSMHDATEGGVLGGLAEMANASGNTFAVSEEEIPVSEETSLVCSAFGIDPLVSVSEGTLLLTCREDKAEAIAKKLRRNNIPATVIGRVSKGASGLWLQRQGSKPQLFAPGRDPFWDAYEQSAAREERRKRSPPRRDPNGK